eukprot:CAMPEP_0178912226 /NCGR_PEP_ID=MMETSP0786-20121207/10140_1 /TAXON_ID=186022 /ORGANISM="Thalassionema frauenfeldii, Strain CCMP 1798" /LENGTH=464 /DNA_ID=CAMNT_0020584775 /DNA_START=78 /DNA_END=1472 /DNA_ORIENTATION=-
MRTIPFALLLVGVSAKDENSKVRRKKSGSDRPGFDDCCDIPPPPNATPQPISIPEITSPPTPSPSPTPSPPPSPPPTPPPTPPECPKEFPQICPISPFSKNTEMCQFIGSEDIPEDMHDAFETKIHQGIPNPPYGDVPAKGCRDGSYFCVCALNGDREFWDECGQTICLLIPTPVPTLPPSPGPTKPPTRAPTPTPTMRPLTDHPTVAPTPCPGCCPEEVVIDDLDGQECDLPCNVFCAASDFDVCPCSTDLVDIESLCQCVNGRWECTESNEGNIVSTEQCPDPTIDQPPFSTPDYNTACKAISPRLEEIGVGPLPYFTAMDTDPILGRILEDAQEPPLNVYDTQCSFMGDVPIQRGPFPDIPDDPQGFAIAAISNKGLRPFLPLLFTQFDDDGKPEVDSYIGPDFGCFYPTNPNDESEGYRCICVHDEGQQFLNPRSTCGRTFCYSRQQSEDSRQPEDTYYH